MNNPFTLKRMAIAGLIGMSLVGASAIAATFAEADKNGDGYLTLEELKAAGMDEYAADFKNLDKNKDGKISKEEFKANR